MFIKTLKESKLFALSSFYVYIFNSAGQAQCTSGSEWEELYWVSLHGSSTCMLKTE